MIQETPVILSKSIKGKIGCTLPNLDVPESQLSDYLPNDLLRSDKAELPELSEPEIMRHFVNLSVKNHHIDRDIFPLGSCTMKYNPKLNEFIASQSQFSEIHPNQSDASSQPALSVLYELEEMLKKITGMNAFTLQPSAGSQGEFVGLLLMREYHKIKGNKKKTILIPESFSLIILERSAILKLALFAFLLILYPIFKIINPASGIVNKTNNVSLGLIENSNVNNIIILTISCKKTFTNR